MTKEKATFEEVMTFWDITDVLRMNEIIDIQEDHEWLEAEDSRRKNRS